MSCTAFLLLLLLSFTNSKIINSTRDVPNTLKIRFRCRRNETQKECRSDFSHEWIDSRSHTLCCACQHFERKPLHKICERQLILTKLVKWIKLCVRDEMSWSGWQTLQFNQNHFCSKHCGQQWMPASTSIISIEHRIVCLTKSRAWTISFVERKFHDSIAVSRAIWSEKKKWKKIECSISLESHWTRPFERLYENSESSGDSSFPLYLFNTYRNSTTSCFIHVFRLWQERTAGVRELASELAAKYLLFCLIIMLYYILNYYTYIMLYTNLIYDAWYP